MRAPLEGLAGLGFRVQGLGFWVYVGVPLEKGLQHPKIKSHKSETSPLTKIIILRGLDNSKRVPEKVILQFKMRNLEMVKVTI